MLSLIINAQIFFFPFYCQVIWIFVKYLKKKKKKKKNNEVSYGKFEHSLIPSVVTLQVPQISS